MPINAWKDLHRTGDMQHLLVSPRPIRWHERMRVREQWRILAKEFINHFGPGDAYMTIMEIERQRAILVARKIISGDTSLQLLIDVKTFELEEARTRFESSSPNNFYEVKAIMEKFHGGTPIDGDKVCVIEFYTKLNMVKNNKPHGQ